MQGRVNRRYQGRISINRFIINLLAIYAG